MFTVSLCFTILSVKRSVLGAKLSLTVLLEWFYKIMNESRVLSLCVGSF